jgi:hypothetical protein
MSVSHISLPFALVLPVTLLSDSQLPNAEAPAGEEGAVPDAHQEWPGPPPG